MKLPTYDPPSPQKACVAVALAPIVVLLAFTAVVIQFIDPDTCFATFLACAIWVIFELHDHQRSVDAYNLAYVEAHLQWRSSETLRRLVTADGTDAGTREFVLAFLDAGRVLMREGPLF